MSSKKKRKSKNLSSPMNIFIFSILFVLAYRLVKHYLDDRDYDRKKDEKKNETVEEVKNEVKDKIPIGVYISVIVVLFVIIIFLSFRSKSQSDPSDNDVVLGSAAAFYDIDAFDLFSTDTKKYTIQQINRIIEDFYNDMNNLQKELDVKKS